MILHLPSTYVKVRALGQLDGSKNLCCLSCIVQDFFSIGFSFVFIA